MNSESPKSFPEKVANVLGEGRMSIDEKRMFLESHQERLRVNADFVLKETYTALFRRIGLEGKTVLNVGAGYSFSPHDYDGVSPMTAALSEVNPDMTLIPLDYNQDRTKSWLLLDTNSSKKNDRIKLEPVTGDATQLPFGNETLDGYLSTNLINEPRVDELESDFVRKMITEAYRVLRPGGFIVVSSFGYIWSEDSNGAIEYNNAIDVEEVVPIEMVRTILEDSGFDLIESISLDKNEVMLAEQRRLVHRPNAVRAGIQDACAFYAVKPQPH